MSAIKWHEYHQEIRNMYTFEERELQIVSMKSSHAGYLDDIVTVKMKDGTKHYLAFRNDHWIKLRTKPK